MIDYEELILARQEALEYVGDCDGDCDHCGMWNVCELNEVPEEE